MNTTLLIHAIVRQTMVLIAALATSAGQRTPLASIADEVFEALVDELSELGLGNKVIADMFGMALRTYHRRASRVSASATEPGGSLWEAVLAFIRTSGPVSRVDVLARFDRDNELVVRSVLRDLVDSGLVYQAGRRETTSYRATESLDPSGDDADAAADQLVLVALHRHGPATAADLAERVPLESAQFIASVTRLRAAGKVTSEGPGGAGRLRCDEIVIPLGAEIGWEAAVFDHYQAMVTALIAKLRQGTRRSDLADKIGGSTFAFDVWGSHPLASEVLGFLKSVREQGISLRARLEEYNAAHPLPSDETPIRVTSYVGQGVREDP